MNAIVVCGGTGGHLFPGIALAEELRARSHDTMLVVSEKRIDRVAAAGAPGFRIESLPGVAWAGWRPDRVLRFALRLARARSTAGRRMDEFRPGVVVGMGGFSTLAPLWAARRRGIPTLIHESNAVAGRANRLLSSWADRCAVGMLEAERWFPKERTVWTGTPVRAALRALPSRAEARKRLGLPFDLPVVLVMGGSQGARVLNRLAVEAAARLGPGHAAWIHLAGELDEIPMREAYAKAGVAARVEMFSHDMAAAYAAADLFLGRCGAASLAEIASAGLPSVLVPFPYAADRHQSANAAVFKRAGAAVAVEEKDWTGERLASALGDLLTNRGKLAAMAAAARGLRQDEAHRRLADEVVALGTRGRDAP
ncbi:MAG: undecaprenyldiphospho-muramoylpentapeptide beta-N-acetylglucosaminyltransferase [Verrucomicrobiae bacterium]|nr:undecaprenyldiphospho-muramoylpentapeptide beta-N-acetylglucosaminyltransferase [Verrucomicrobiae bacterium]